MIALIPLPYRILAAVFFALALLASGFTAGVKITRDHAAAQQLVAEKIAADRYRAEVARGNDLSAKLAAAESNIQTKTIERIKYVPTVTTGRDCLSAGAVGLLNGSAHLGLSAPAGKPAAEGAATPTATDTDVESWAIDASDRYETCAVRLNGLIDWETGRPQPAGGSTGNVPP